MHEKLHVQCEVLFGQNPAEGSTGPSQIKRVLRTMWKRPPRNTAHMRQHEKMVRSTLCDESPLGTALLEF